MLKLILITTKKLSLCINYLRLLKKLIDRNIKNLKNWQDKEKLQKVE